MEDEIINLNSKNKKFKMMLKRPGLIEDQIAEHGCWEPGIAGIIYSFIKEGSTFLDVGANIGYHTLYMASTSPNIRCICFEPNPAVLEQLRNNIKINGFENITAYGHAAGNSCGWVEFYALGNDQYNRGLSAIEYYNDIGNNYNKITVRVVTLDSFLDDETKTKISAIKIDTQGYEYQVLEGAVETIAKSRPVICFEAHGCSKQESDKIIKLLSDYKVFKVEPWTGKLECYNDADDEQLLGDFLCIPR